MGLFATGTSCLALVCVIGRRRVPAPPERIRARIPEMLARRGCAPTTKRNRLEKTSDLDGSAHLAARDAARRSAGAVERALAPRAVAATGVPLGPRARRCRRRVLGDRGRPA